MARAGEQNPVITYRTCAWVWCALVLLLGATIATAKLQLLAQFSVLAALAIATIKAGLVITYFMHLKYESWRLKLMLLVAIIVVAVMIAFTFIDVWYR